MSELHVVLSIHPRKFCWKTLFKASWAVFWSLSGHAIKTAKTYHKAIIHFVAFWYGSWQTASQRVMRVEPVSHASHASHHVSHARQKFEGKRIHFLANHKQFNFFNICSMKLAFRRQQESLLKKMYEKVTGQVARKSSRPKSWVLSHVARNFIECINLKKSNILSKSQGINS